MKPAPISVDSSVSANDTAELSVHIPRTPTQIGPYKIIKLIGRGGMGSVYRARVVISCQIPIGVDVALKLLRETDDNERKRFAREASYLQALQHPGIVRVLDNGEYEGQPYIVMQLVEGRHADDLLMGGNPIEQQLIADLGVQALDALHVAHMHGILHRDIKPGNIMIGPNGQVKLVDFGLAQYIDTAESHLTATGAVVGTPAYMSPEQASGRRENISRRSDVYSMGACLYELATGKQPFTADNSVALLRCIIEDSLTPPSHIRKDLARDLETIILKAMAKDWRDRYHSAEAMAADLRRFRLGLRLKTARPNFLRPLLRSAWQQRAVLTMIALVIFIAVSATTFVLRSALKRAEQAGAASTGSVLTTSPSTILTGSNVPLKPIEPTNPWVEILRQDIALDEPMSPLALVDGAVLGPELKRVNLPSVSGPVRLSVTVELLDVSGVLELIVSDRDVGKGYRVRLLATQTNDRLELLREDKVVRSRDLGQLIRGQPLLLTIERVEETITATLDRREPLSFRDLIPIEGIYADTVHIAFIPGQVRISQVVLERQRSTLYVSALAKPDSLRQARLYLRAKEEYERFINDHPDAPEVRAAQLRIALCLEDMKSATTDEQLLIKYDEMALEKYNEIASLYRDDENYVLAATFHAWGCALRLGRFEEAEKYFEAIRRDYDLKALLPTIPEATVKDLVTGYLTRAHAISTTDPERAVRLFMVGADIAGYLNQPQEMAEAQGRAGELLMQQSRYTKAAACYRIVIDDDRVNNLTRTQFRLRSAEVERLRNRYETAEAIYESIMAQPVQFGDTGQWARLWLGDMYAQRGDIVGALTCWGKGDNKTLPGRIMYHLLTKDNNITIKTGPLFLNQIRYFNARLHQLRGRTDDYRNQLEEIVKAGPAHDWPVLMANHLIELLKTSDDPD
jgi:serine/threonine protein kinase/tetratricopeptide (TPR) repeat protein